MNLRTFRLKQHGWLALVALAVFTLFAQVNLAHAEYKSVAACKYGNPNAGANTTLQYGNYESQTTQNFSGCTFLSVKLRRWLYTTLMAEVYKDSSGTGGGYTPWASIPVYNNNNYVALHQLKRVALPEPVFTRWTTTSHDGAHSSFSWFCSGTANGSSNCY